MGSMQLLKPHIRRTATAVPGVARGACMQMHKHATLWCCWHPAEAPCRLTLQGAELLQLRHMAPILVVEAANHLGCSVPAVAPLGAIIACIPGIAPVGNDDAQAAAGLQNILQGTWSGAAAGRGTQAA